MIPFKRLNIVVGVVLTGLVVVMGFLTDRSPGDVLLFTLVSSSGHVEGASGRSPRQSHIVALSLRKTQEKPRVLTGDFSAARAPSVSYDGQWCLFAGKRAAVDPWQIWEMRVDGSHLRQVTRGTRDATDPCYLPDGRIAFSGSVPDHPEGHSLFTCTREGSQVRRITFGSSDDVRPTVLPDGRILFRRSVIEEEEGVLMTVNTDGTGLQRLYGEARADEQVLFQRSPETSTSGLYESDPVKHRVGRLLYRDLHADAIDPVLAAPHPRPRALTSVVDETKKTGWLICLNVYLSQLPEVAALKPGDVKGVQVVAVGTNGRSPLQQEEVLGAAVVEEDGSFYMEVPADEPLRLRLLGRDGRMVASLNSGIWVRPNENRGCIGCHEDPELSPENQVPLAVTKPAVVIAPSSRRNHESQK